MRNQCLDATLDRWHFHLVSIVCLNMQLEYVRRILLLLNHPQKELHVTVVKFAVKGIGVRHSVLRQLSFSATLRLLAGRGSVCQ